MNELAHKPLVSWIIATVIVLAAIALALLAYAPPGYAAARQGDIVVQSVNTSSYPELALTVILPGDLLAAGKPSFALFENGAPVRPFTAKPLGESKPSAVVLAVDVSGSMRGRPLADARAAARRFIERMRPQDAIALVAFSAEPRLVSPFTADRAALLSALDSLQAGGETALYDAVTLSADTLRDAPGGRRAMVVLSDGGDTVSTSGIDAAIRALGGARSRTPVYAVALTSPEADLAGLERIARASGGRYLTAEGSDGLAAIYAGIADELRARYEIRFMSARPKTKEVEVELTAAAGATKARGWVVFDNPALLQASAPTYRFAVPTMGGPAAMAVLSGFFALLFVAATMLAFGVISVVAPERTSLDQLAFYDQIRGTKEGARQPASALQARVMDAVGQVAEKRGFTELVNQRLERAGLPLRPVEYILFHLLAVIALGVVTTLSGGGPIGGIAVVLIATIVPIFVLDAAGTRRRRKFDAQLPDVLNLVSGSLRAGYGLLQSIGLIVQEVKQPAVDEFRRVQTEARLGLPLEDALEKMADRLGSEDFRWAVMAMNIQREVGGNLAEILDIVAKTVREREELRGHVKTLTEESRLSGLILGVLPFFIASVLFVTNPRYIMTLAVEPAGRTMILSAIGLLLLGFWWLKRVMTIEV